MDTENSLQQEIHDLRIQLQAKESLLAKISSKNQVWSSNHFPIPMTYTICYPFIYRFCLHWIH